MSVNYFLKEFVKLSEELNIDEDLSLDKLVSNDEKLKQLSELPSFISRIKFCLLNFKKISSGSSRVVFEYDNNYVLKVAKNPKGVLQNGQEDDGFVQQSYKNIVTNVLKSDSNDQWLVVEKAEKISKYKFAQIAGFTLEQLGYYLEYFKTGHNKWKLKKSFINLDDNDFAQEIAGLVVNTGLLIGDLQRPSSWGLVNGKLKLIDYGITEDIYERFYK